MWKSRKLRNAVAVVSAAAFLTVGCASAVVGAEADKQVPSFIPEQARSLYVGYDSVPLTQNPLAGYTAPKGALKYCLAESYTKEAFRVGPPLGSVGMFQKLVEQLQGQGKASGPLVITDSNNVITAQLSQMNDLIQQGCQVIITYPGSASGLCSAVDKAFAKGILVVSYGTETSCEHMVSVSVNGSEIAALAADNLAKRLGGKGNVFLMHGIQGVAIVDVLARGARRAFAKYPGIKIIGEDYGSWTPSIAKAKMLQFLATHPGQIDGVWQQGLMSASIYQAFEQAGRAGSAKVEAFAGTCSGLALWHQIGGENWAYLEAGEPFAYMTMQAIVRIVEGAKPVTNVLNFPPQIITPATMNDWYESGMTLDSTCFPNAPKQYQLKGNELDSLFTNVPSSLPELTWFTGKTF
jgi:ribose transport system substrate-binding protein